MKFCLPASCNLQNSSCALYLLGFFCLSETHTMPVSNDHAYSMKWSWSDPQISLPVAFTGQYQSLATFPWHVFYCSMRWFLRAVSFADKEVQAGVTHIFLYSLNAFNLNM